MGCTDPVRQCLDWHFRPHLAHAVIENNGDRIRARCPSCGTLRALTISVGDKARITYGCFNGCPRPDLRLAFRNADIRSDCIPLLTRNDDRSLSQAAVAVIQQGTPATRAQTLIRVYLINLGYAHWPKGNELLKLAAECGVSKTDAYGAKRSGALLSSTPVLQYLPD
jgi:hypothetical protein